MAGPWEQYAAPTAEAAPWEQYQGAAADDGARALPEGVAPSSAGGGRGRVNPGLSLADARPRTQTVYDPISGMPLGEQEMPETDARPLDERRTKAPGRLTAKDIPGMTPLSLAQDALSGALQIGPTAVKGVGDLTRLVTGDRFGKGITGFADRGIKSIQDIVGSERGAMQRRQFEQDMQDPALNAADVIVGNPGALTDMALPTIGSMALPVAAAGAATKLATGTRAAQLAAAIEPATVAARANAAREAAVIGTTVAQNAGSGYSESRDQGLPQDQAYMRAAITAPFTYVAGRLTGGGAEGQVARSLAGSQTTMGAVRAGVQGAAKEGLQEGAESVGDYAGETVGKGEEFDLNKASKQVAVGATLGAVVGGGFGAASAAGAAREARIKQMQDAGETATAQFLQQRHDKATAAEAVDGELERMPGTPAYAQAYRALRGTGVKPAESAARAAMFSVFGDTAASAGLPDKALSLAAEKAKDMPLDQVPGFLQKYTNALAARGLIQPFDGLGQLAATVEQARDDAIERATSTVYAQGDIRQSMDSITALEDAQQNQALAQDSNASPAINNEAPAVDLARQELDGNQQGAPAATTGESNVSGTPSIPGVLAAADGGRGDQPAPGMAVGMGAGATAGPAVDTGDLRAESAGVPAPLPANRDAAVAPTTIEPAYARMTYEELEAAFDDAKTANAAMDVAAVQKHFGDEAAGQFARLSRKQQDRWLDANANPAFDEDISTFNGVDEERIRDFMRAANDFDPESADSLGRSIAIKSKNFDQPGFVNSPEFASINNALAYARAKGWSERDVLNGMRSRAVEWAGPDALELFDKLFSTQQKGADNDTKSSPRTKALPAPQAAPVEATANDRSADTGAATAGARAGAGDVQAPRVELGRNNTPLSDGGKAFKTRRAADDARKLQPMMRVIRAVGGYALTEKTPAQLAAQDKAARRLRNPQTSPDGEAIPAHAMIASEGGLSPFERADMGMDGNVTVGNRKLFAGAGKGLSIERATERLVEDGYLPDGASHDDARALIKRSLNRPQYTPEGTEFMAEKEAQARFDAASVEAEAVFAVDARGDFQTQAIDDADIPWDAPSNTTAEAAMRAMGFTEQEIQDEIQSQTANGPAVAQGNRSDNRGPDESSASPPPGDMGSQLGPPGKNPRSGSPGPTATQALNPKPNTDPSTEGFSVSGEDSADTRPTALIELRKRASVLDALRKCMGAA